MQHDLFGPAAPPPHAAYCAPPKADFLEKHRFSLRFDQAIVAFIGLLMVYVLVFSYGVEKGKRFAVAELKAERAKRESMAQEFRQKLYEKDGAPTSPAAQTPAAQEDRPDSEPAAGDLPRGMYTIQVITFKSPSAAAREIGRYAEKGRRGFVIPSGSFHQVCIDRYETREKANQVLKELKGEGLAPHDAYVRPMPQ